MLSIFLVQTSLISCSENDRHPDKTYFMALKALEKHNEKEAARLFKKGVKKCTPIAARKCAENLVTLGNRLERNESALNLIKNYGNGESPENYNAILVAARELEKNAEYFPVLKATENLAFENLDVPNELIRIRLKCLQKKNSPSFEKEFEKYYLTRAIVADAPVTSEGSPVTSETGDLATANDEKPLSILDFRLLVAKKRYTEAFANFNEVVALCEEKGFYPQIISDLGKAAIYGASNFENAAYKFENLLKKMNATDPIALYNAHFYAGRLYAKSGNFPRAVKSHFTAAMDIAKNDASRFDNALWYLLKSTLTNSTADAISLIEKYADDWNDAKYFDDIFDSLLVFLLSSRSYEKIATTYLTIKPFATDDVRAKFAYVTGRLVQEKLVGASTGRASQDASVGTSHEAAVGSDIDATTFFQDALNTNGDPYYKIMAAARLKLSKADFEKAMLNVPVRASNLVPEPVEGASFDSLLSGYEIFGFPQKIYPEWLANREKISNAASFKAARFLETCHDEKNNFGLQGLRIAARTVTTSNGTSRDATHNGFTKDQYRLAYPQFYKKEIFDASEKNGLPTNEIFALVRTESFFDPKVKSHAGAIGLTQLMETTATDVARKMKIKDFDLSRLTEPKTNIDFGTFYLAELASRVENQKILGFCSYNAGISNIRRWAKNIRADYLKTGGPMYRTTGIAPDLFLEIIPFEETRGYGRKLLAASVIYGWLYEDLDPIQVVNEIFN